jgi:hypothetical protein
MNSNLTLCIFHPGSRKPPGTNREEECVPTLDGRRRPTGAVEWDYACLRLPVGRQGRQGIARGAPFSILH